MVAQDSETVITTGHLLFLQSIRTNALIVKLCAPLPLPSSLPPPPLAQCPMYVGILFDSLVYVSHG